MKVTLVIMFIMLTILETQTARILVVTPTATVSHHACAKKITLELCRRGHEVVSISPYEEKNAPDNLKWIPIRVKSLLEPVPEMIEESKKKLDFFRRQHRLWTILNSYTKHIVNLVELRRFIEEDNSKFDLVIAEDFFQQIFYVFSYKYRAPLILLSNFGMGHYMNEYMGNPLELSYVPHEFFDMCEDMTILNRFINIVYTLYDILARRYYSLSFQNKLAQDVFNKLGEIPNLEDLERNASLLLINTHYSTSIVRPYVPNIVEIGGIHMDPVKPLGQKLKQLLDEAKEGAILFSFGSVMGLNGQPREKVVQILKALGSVTQRVVLKWDSKESLPILYENIYPYDWIPQNDVLAHHNLRAFVTHEGLHSAMEAIYHGVPTICIPFYGDQHMNCMKSAKMGYGIALDMKHLDQHIFRKALEDILHVKSYKARAVELSLIFKDRPTDVMNSTMFWIEYVVRHRGADFLTSQSRNMPWYTYHMVDIIVIVFGVVCAMFTIPKYLIRIRIRTNIKEKLKKT